MAYECCVRGCVTPGNPIFLMAKDGDKQALIQVLLCFHHTKVFSVCKACGFQVGELTENGFCSVCGPQSDEGCTLPPTNIGGWGSPRGSL